MSNEQRELQAQAERMLAALDQALSTITDKLDETAAGLDTWMKNKCTNDSKCGHGCIHPSHAANRLRKMSREIKSKETK